MEAVGDKSGVDNVLVDTVGTVIRRSTKGATTSMV